MKRICKIFAVLLVMLITMFSFSITASATEVSNSQDGLVASIISEKDSYKANEDIELTFKVTNSNDFAVDNVSLEAIIPDGLTLKNEADTTVNTVSLGSGESLEFTLTAVKESSVIVVPTGTTAPSTESQTQTQPVPTKATENTTVVQTDSIQATTAKVNSATSDTGNVNNSDNTPIKTGNSMSYLLAVLLCLVCLAVVIISFKFRKKATKYLSLVLCVCISVGSFAVVGVTNTMAQETPQQMSFEVSKTITVDSEHYIIQSSLIYDKIVKESDNDYENFEKVQQTTVNIEKKYLNSDGYVDYKDTQKLFEEITGYLQTQKDLGIIDYFTQGSSSIFVKMKSGINYMYIPEYKDYLSSGSEQRIITFEPVKSSFEYKFEKFYADFYIDFGSLCLGTENLNTDLIENAELLGKESEYKYSSDDSYIDEEVTVNKLLNLSPNSLILFEGHGGYSEETGSVLWTDEKVNENVTYNFGEDAIVYSKDKTIGVTYQFFEKLQNNSLKNSTIYLGACCSAKDERLANSLIDKGAENVLGYSDIVGIRYEIGLRTFLLYGLTLNHDNGDAYTLEEAYNFALSTYGTKDSSEPYAYLKILQREHYGTLSASVISSDNTPLSDVRVDAYLKAESGKQFINNTYTDDKGNFSMELQGGSYELRFNKDGYKTATTPIKISNDVMTVLKDPIVMQKKENYKEDFINALLENEDEWYQNGGATVGYQSALTFTDLNFDGKPEFIMQYGGGSMRNNNASAYYFSNNKIYKTNTQFQNNLTGYYDKSNNDYVILGNAQALNGVNYRWCGNFELSFDGENIMSDYYSSYRAKDENYTGKFKYTYYNGANGYADVNGISEITEAEYNKINEEKLKNLVNINMKREFILCSDWKKYSASEKRQALEKAYDSFTYDKYTESIFESIPHKFGGNTDWGTTINLDNDGSFSGKFLGLKIDDTGSNYPNGTVYIREFSGKFTEPKQTDEYTYSMKLENSLELVGGANGEEYYENGIRYIYCNPVGFENTDEFYIYLPGIKITDLPKELVSMYHLTFQTSNTLLYYTIYNTGSKYGLLAYNQN